MLGVWENVETRISKGFADNGYGRSVSVSERG